MKRALLFLAVAALWSGTSLFAATIILTNSDPRNSDLIDRDWEARLRSFVTGSGTFDLELFDQFTPITARNFLDYLTAGRYNGSIFHDVSPGAVLRGGRFQLVTQTGQPSRLDQIVENAAIQNEPALSNQAGTVAMSQFVGEPNSATSQFFFNLKNNSNATDFSFDTQNGGLAVFGALRNNGTQVINALASIPPQDRGGAFTRIPLQNFPQPPAGDFPGALQSANVAYLETVSVVRSVDAQNGDALAFVVAGNTNSSLVTATITGGRLVLSYAAGQTGAATITLRATDAEGRSVETSFTVTVT
jgi:cyclophilin family peptidyl-prolyl cis-trans isomerase